MERWHLPSVAASGKREPRVLFSHPECRAVLIDLNAGEELGDHRLHESAIVSVVSGRLAVELDGREVECAEGTLLRFSAGETRALRALAPARVLLILAPWPGEGHFREGEEVDPERVPPEAAVPPLGP
ncbi:MAG TPA: cupin domain-containing protein [Gaiellaceae bacterium]|nr:cupin domain-containing protein [Gaiellaceae bacterium]